MKYESLNGKIILTGFDSFDVAETLECGQCFRFTKLGEKEYIVVARGRTLHIKQANGITEFYPCELSEFENIWLDYFDLKRDYLAIKEKLSRDPVMEHAISLCPGIRILNQEPWECLLSFIISQNMNIPRIKMLVRTLAELYGTKTGDFYAFPTVEQLKGISIQELIDCKMGFRAKYLKDAIDKIAAGEIDIAEFPKKTTAELKSILTGIYGVGEKVADCVLLFSCGRHESFPMDVWIKRVMQALYFDGREVRPKEVYSFAQEKFGENAGFAQQYLFHYGRNLEGMTK